jgi:hypothetical protein
MNTYTVFVFLCPHVLDLFNLTMTHANTTIILLMYLTSEKIHFVTYMIRLFANNGNGVNGFNNGR